jgi:urea transport system permease protein
MNVMAYITKSWFVLILTILPFISIASANESISSSFTSSLEQLTASKLKDRAKGIDLLIKSTDERLVAVINALLDNKLYYRKADKTIAFVLSRDGTKYATSVLSAEELGEVSSRKWKKIIINNAIRTQLRNVLSLSELSDSDQNVRINAIQQVLGQMDVNQIVALEARLSSEDIDDVQALLKMTIATLKLKQGSGDRLSLIAEVSTSVHPSVRQVLADIIATDENAKVQRKAKSALKKIEDKVNNYDKLETLFFGLSLGSVLVLAAIGLAITFGVMGVINMAHGELIMLGAYTTYVVQQMLPNWIEYSVLIAIPLAFIVSGTVGIMIERGIIRHLYGRPLETLLATFGVSLILQQIVRSLFGPLNMAVESPSWMSGVWQVNDALALTWNRLYIIIFCLIVFATLFVILNRTRLGLQVRAVSQNRSMARAMGIKANWVDAMTFGLGSGVAGVAGVALSQLTNVGPNLGQAYIIDSFMVVVFGGVGNLWGTLIAGMGLGITNKLLEPWSGAVLAKILVLIFIILFIQKRPKGLFPQKGRSA